MIYFTSDTHWYHKNIIQYCNRPVQSVEEMNELLIQKWNDRIRPSDEVYHLGDFAFCNRTRAEEIFTRLHGIKFLIRGNHDGKQVDHLAWEWIRDYYVLKVSDVYETNDDKFASYHQPIVLSHFPMISWDGMVHGSWHLHGHCHGTLKDTGALRLDAGVDVWNMGPVSYDEIKAKMALRTVVPVDHHKDT